MKTERFLADSAPPALVARVRERMRVPRTLKLHAPHLQQRIVQRGGAPWLNEPFDAALWELVSIEVRRDSGKFVNTAWERTVAGVRWRVVIGLHDTVQTVMPVDRVRPLRASGVDSAFFEFVNRVNEELLERDGIRPANAP